MQVHADITVTFAAPKVDLVMGTENVGKMIVADIGIPAEFLQSDLHLSEAHDFAALFRPRKRDSNKGMYRARAGDRRSARKIGRGGDGRARGAARGRGIGHGRVRGRVETCRRS